MEVTSITRPVLAQGSPPVPSYSMVKGPVYPWRLRMPRAFSRSMGPPSVFADVSLDVNELGTISQGFDPVVERAQVEAGKGVGWRRPGFGEHRRHQRTQQRVEVAEVEQQSEVRHADLIEEAFIQTGSLEGPPWFSTSRRMPRPAANPPRSVSASTRRAGGTSP